MAKRMLCHFRSRLIKDHAASVLFFGTFMLGALGCRVVVAEGEAMARRPGERKSVQSTAESKMESLMSSSGLCGAMVQAMQGIAAQTRYRAGPQLRTHRN
ncbi:hypothetical protein VULLAG_LOCUS12848 [Vulpes lagopus]